MRGVLSISSACALYLSSAFSYSGPCGHLSLACPVSHTVSGLTQPTHFFFFARVLFLLFSIVWCVTIPDSAINSMLSVCGVWVIQPPLTSWPQGCNRTDVRRRKEYTQTIAAGSAQTHAGSLAAVPSADCQRPPAGSPPVHPSDSGCAHTPAREGQKNKSAHRQGGTRGGATSSRTECAWRARARLCPSPLGEGASPNAVLCFLALTQLPRSLRGPIVLRVSQRLVLVLAVSDDLRGLRGCSCSREDGRGLCGCF